MSWLKRGTLAAAVMVVACVSGSLPGGAAAPPVGAAAPSNPVYTWDYMYNSGPVAVTGPYATVTDTQAANYGGLLVDTTGHVYAWGNAAHPTASKIHGPKGIVSVGEGFDFGAAASSSGTVWAWGNDSSGQLCNGAMTSNDLAPKVIANLSDVSAVSGGADHLLVLESTGVVMACGGGTYGQLGDGQTASSDVPVEVQRLTHVVAVNAGSQCSVAVDSSGRVWDWGDNALGQLGDGNTSNSDVPVDVPLPSPAVQAYAGGDSVSDGSVVALLDDGEVYAWGDDSNGQLGNGKTGRFSDVPVRTLGLPDDIVAVATDAYTSYALDSAGDLYAWGRVHNQNEATPSVVETGVSNISAVAATTVITSSS